MYGTACSPTAEHYSALTGHPIKAYHGPVNAIANDKDVNLVAISVKAPDHRKAALTVIEAGKDLFLEWPVGINLAETVEIAEAAKRKGIQCLVGMQARHSPVFEKVGLPCTSCVVMLSDLLF